MCFVCGFSSKERPLTDLFQSRIQAIHPEGEEISPIDDIRYPNGICFSCSTNLRNGKINQFFKWELDTFPWNNPEFSDTEFCTCQVCDRSYNRSKYRKPKGKRTGRPPGRYGTNTSTTTNMSCCPPGSWPDLNNSDYKCKGVVETLDEASDFKVYKTGSGGKCVVWNYDIFGFDGGRTRQMADYVASQGYLVVIPDYYRGVCGVSKEPADQRVAFVKANTDMEKLKTDFESFVLPYAKKSGATSIGTFGFCWGSVPVIHFSSFNEIKCGVSFHPSHPPIFGMIDANEEEHLKAVKCPQLLMPASNDAETVKTGGLAQKVLGEDKCQVVEFPDMTHGWSIRGDCSQPDVERDVKKAFTDALKFIASHL